MLSLTCFLASLLTSGDALIISFIDTFVRAKRPSIYSLILDEGAISWRANTLHDVVVQTPWARKTAFQGGSMDRGRDGKRKTKKERATGNNSIKRRTPSN
ncbi:hypothetical protein PUN28_000918 [Cardiocondyla obscurior]|uniref:Secreted protein n=1 Tax=Cardiocondyla obscurior TaxID=286306 RepID=A0AAW2H1Z0_9HYME